MYKLIISFPPKENTLGVPLRVGLSVPAFFYLAEKGQIKKEGHYYPSRKLTDSRPQTYLTCAFSKRKEYRI